MGVNWGDCVGGNVGSGGSEQLWNEEVKKGRRVLSWKGVFQSFLLTVSLVDFSLVAF